MTEYELIDAVNSTMSIYLSTFLAYLTIVSAYLIAAFILGDKLTNQQVFVISGLFLFAAVLTMWSMWGLGSRIVYTAEALTHANPEYPILIKTPYRNSLAIVCALGIFASFKFMWDVRHPKSE
jgi:Zn-dependent protease with chaperone function